MELEKRIFVMVCAQLEPQTVKNIGQSAYEYFYRSLGMFYIQIIKIIIWQLQEGTTSKAKLLLHFLDTNKQQQGLNALE